MSDSQHIRWIIQENQHHPHFGRLVQWHEQGAWHYCVQINDFDAIGWSQENGNPKDWVTRGHMNIWPIDWRNASVAMNVIHRDRQSVYRALMSALDEFNNHWNYELFRFNCEHFARLIATGECVCYQVEHFATLHRIPLLGRYLIAMGKRLIHAWFENTYARDAINGRNGWQPC